MLIWILALLLFGLFGTIGFYKGGIRMAVSLVGLFLGVILALPLGPVAKPLLPLVKVTSPIWLVLLPPVVVFVMISSVFVGLGFFIHRLVALHYKYKTDDYHRLAWERLNHRIGLCLGLVAGTVHLILLGLIIQIPGYLTVQVTSEENSSTLLTYLNKARADLRSTGLERAVTLIDPMPPIYYLASDILGLVYHNPLLKGRLSDYPPYLSLGERQQFQDIATDTEYLQMLQTKAEVRTILDNPKTQAIINDSALIQEISQVDLKDLRQYLETGKSPKYDDEKILGRWELDVNALVRQIKKQNPNISANELTGWKKFATSRLSGTSLTATPDNKVIIKAPAAPPPPAANAGAAATPATPTMDPQTQARYGLTRQPAAPPRQGLGSPTALAPAIRQRLGGGTQPPARPGPNRAPTPGVASGSAPAPVVPSVPPPDIRIAGQGTWKNESDKYDLEIQDERGRSVKLEAAFENGRLLLSVANLPAMVFEKTR